MPIQETRWAILQHLKRQKASTVETLAQALQMAPMTVRQHLAVLEREDLISSHSVRKGPGRPAFSYTLTDNAEELFPKSYDKLAARLLDEVRALDGPEIAFLSGQEKIALVFRNMAVNMAGDYREDIKGETLQERTGQLVNLLEEREGTLSEWTPTEDGAEVIDYNCPFQRVAAAEPELCSWHVHFLAEVLSAEVHMERSIIQGQSCCSYQVEPTAVTQDPEHTSTS